MPDHKFLFEDLNKTMSAIRAIADENLILKAKINKCEKYLNYPLDNIISAYEAGNMVIFNCDNCNTKYLIIGEKVPGKIFNVFCNECHNLKIFDRKPVFLIQL